MVPPETKQTCTNDLRATLGAPQSAPKRPWVSCTVAHTRARHGNSPKEYLERPPWGGRADEDVADYDEADGDVDERTLAAREWGLWRQRPKTVL